MISIHRYHHQLWDAFWNLFYYLVHAAKYWFESKYLRMSVRVGQLTKKLSRPSTNSTENCKEKHPKKFRMDIQRFGSPRFCLKLTCQSPCCPPLSFWTKSLPSPFSTFQSASRAFNHKARVSWSLYANYILSHQLVHVCGCSSAWNMFEPYSRVGIIRLWPLKFRPNLWISIRNFLGCFFIQFSVELEGLLSFQSIDPRLFIIRHSIPTITNEH